VRNLERAGVPRGVAMAMVGHKTEAIYRRYAIVSVSDLVRAARQLDDAAGIPAARAVSGNLAIDPFAEETVARPPRLELGTPGLEGRCSIQLSYGRILL
jgi:hypothetical protein